VIETGPQVSHFPDRVLIFGILILTADPTCLRSSHVVLCLITDTFLPHFGQMKIPMLIIDLQKEKITPRRRYRHRNLEYAQIVANNSFNSLPWSTSIKVFAMWHRA